MHSCANFWLVQAINKHSFNGWHRWCLYYLHKSKISTASAAGTDVVCIIGTSVPSFGQCKHKISTASVAGTIHSKNRSPGGPGSTNFFGFWIMLDLRIFCAIFRSQKLRLCYFLRFLHVWLVVYLSRIGDMSIYANIYKFWALVPVYHDHVWRLKCWKMCMKA